MNWLTDQVFQPRPIVIVEDHAYHISKLLAALHANAPTVLDSTTIVCIDRPGSDTDSAVTEYLNLYPTIQIAARVSDKVNDSFDQDRLFQLHPKVVTNQMEYCSSVAQMIRSGGMLIQDVELEFLDFIPKDRWWETTLLATTIRGILGERKLHCVFFSNKRGYEATFGADLLAAGHDPRDVLNKNELEKIVVPKMKRFVDDQFSHCLTWRHIDDGSFPESLPVRDSGLEHKELSECLDLILWPIQNKAVVLGGGVLSKSNPEISLSEESNEYQTWRLLIENAIRGGVGVSTSEVGYRIAPSGAAKAEATNAAARHIHTLRKRLTDSRFIVTVDGHYRLGSGLRVGLVE